MQGQRSVVGSSPDTLGFDHGSMPSDATGLDQQIWSNMQNSSQNHLSEYLPSNASNTFMNSMTGEEPNLSGRNLGEPSSTDGNGRKAEHGWSSSMNAFAEVVPILDERRFAAPNNFSLSSASVNLSTNQILNGPLFPQSSISDSINQDLNISSGFAGPNTYKSSSSQNVQLPSSSSSADPRGLPSGSNGCLVEEKDARRGCKRKALEGNVGQSSATASPNYYHRAEGSVWHGVESRRHPSRGLRISSPSEPSLIVSNQGLRLGFGGVSSECPLSSASGESSRRNLRMRINPPHQQELAPIHISSTGIRINNSLNLRLSSPADNTISYENLVAAARTPTLQHNQQSARWNGNSISRPGSSNVATPREESTATTMPRNISEHPMFVPAGGMRNLAQNPVNWSVNGGSNVSLAGNVAATSRVGPSSGVHPSSAAVPPNRVSHRNHPHYPRRLVEIVRRSLLANSSEYGGSSRNISSPGSGSPAFTTEMSPSGEQGRNLSNSRSAMLPDRHVHGTFGILRSSPSSSQGGRNRLMSEHIRNVLDMMRRGEVLRFEDVMILDRAVFFGMADIHDRHRDMRLDVDNMSYEELLALEERIGNVNTGLSEETILTRLKRKKCLTSTTTDQLEVEPCCICQEEYKYGEDLGMLECGHDFHTDCIKQWLKQKNLCPICKTKALVC